ncbi:MAG: hypothetical protein METHSR3v1_890004 [Methanothrix sp.]|nr:MAG: hypothetical protein METHSR3v1_890004 [Methanothrix sp.]
MYMARASQIVVVLLLGREKLAGRITGILPRPEFST